MEGDFNMLDHYRRVKRLRRAAIVAYVSMVIAGFAVLVLISGVVGP